MKFVVVGILGILVTAAAAYLYFVPLNQVANEAVVTARQASDELGIILGISKPKIRSASGEGQAEAAEAAPQSTPAYNRSRARSASTGSSGAVLPPLPPEPIPAELQDEALSLKTIDDDSYNETRIEVQPSGRKTVIRLRDGEVVDIVDLPQ